ncbi:MAG: hypothetical protein Kow00117_00040 [Phototrophicales bacterium]|nr:MAG: hypothetical protein CUN56_06145 [Phototrophicales bacterium]RMG75421.1 MAG: hypothetical protein D6711_06700 [Chloroflexota bacterium]
MRVRLWAALASAVTFGIGLLVLIGLTVNEALLESTPFSPRLANDLRGVVDVILQLTTITIALTILIGILNLLLVHLQRLTHRASGMIYSLVLLLSFGLVVILAIANRDESLVLLETVQVSVESALAGLLFVALVYGAYRMMRHQVTWRNTLFVVVLLLVLIAAVPLNNMEAMQNFRDWLMRTPVSAGARGLLLGIALGTLVTGVRVLIGIDRSYRE